MYSQIGINTGNTIDASAALEIESNSKGLLLPRLTNHTLVTDPTDGLMIYDIDDACVNIYAGKKWINLCASTGTSTGVSIQCGDGYTTETVKSIEVTGPNGGVSFLVTGSGELMVAGRVFNQFEGMTNEFNYDFNVINGPWPSGSVLYADLTATTSNTALYGVVGTTDGLYYQLGGSTNWTKATSYSGGTITKVQVSKSGGTSILDVNGDVYYTSNLSSDTFSKIASLDTVTITDIVAGGGNGTSGGTTYINYAWATGDTELYYWETDPTNIQSHTFTSGIVDVDSGGKPRNITPTMITLNNGDLYLIGAPSYYGLTGTDFTTPVALTLTPIDRALDSDEKVVKVGVAQFDTSHFVTNKENVYSHTDDTGWYHEYEMKVSDPTTVDFSVPGNARGVMAIIDGNLAVWAADDTGTGPNTGNGDHIAEGSGIGSAARPVISTPVYVPICTKN